MTIEKYIENLDLAITESNFIKDWGGISENKEDAEKGIFGISKKEKCNGNFYGFNDFGSSGYMYISNEESQTVSENRLIKTFEFVVNVNVFDSKNLKTTSFNMTNYLWKKGYNLNVGFKKSKDNEYSQIQLKHKVFIGCGEVLKLGDNCYC